ncbi:MAG: Rid family hydrolase [Planctomycetia bacterium]|nr:Rid family hydrolase [Planctomycetia bacterium]
MIRKESSAGIGYSVVEINGVRHVFAAAVPRTGTDLAHQLHDALGTIEAVIDEEGTRGSIVKQSVFLRDADQIGQCRRLIKAFYGRELPATTYVPQAPCQGKLLSIEACGVGRRPGEVEIERRGERVVITRHNDVAWIHCDQVFPETLADGVYDRSLDAFRRMSRHLADAGARYDHVVRTWLYLGDIVGPEGATQRYKELNRARTDFYRDVHFGNNHVAPGAVRDIYPASTGIGTDGGDVLMSCIALVTPRDDVRLVPLENPQQTSAFDYAAKYGPTSPKFARAMAVVAGSMATIFVSGTASITDSTSRHPDDVEAQTRQTLDNIEALISAGNFARHDMSGLGATLADLAQVRVYIKRQSDYEKTRAVCEGRLGELPIIYAVADVCRPELLVEVEGVAFSSS